MSVLGRFFGYSSGQGQSLDSVKEERGERHSLSQMAEIYKRITARLKEPEALSGSSCEGLVEDLREISEILLWGEQNDHQELFDYFCEKEMLSSFVKVISMASVSVTVKVQLLQTMSLLTQNLKTRTSLIYVFSNDHINNLISAPCDWSSDEELLSYYITFVKSLALRLDQEMLTLFFHNDQFVLYTVPIRLYNSSDAMVRTSVRTLTLAIYQVADRSCMDFLVTHSGGYFSLLSQGLREQWQKVGKLSTSRRVAEAAVDDIVDVLLYISDIFTVDNPNIQPLLNLLVDKMSMYALEPILAPRQEAPNKILATFVMVQISHYLNAPEIRTKLAEFSPAPPSLPNPDEADESISVLDAARLLESFPNDLPKVSSGGRKFPKPELAESCLDLVKSGYEKQWNLLTIELLLALYKAVIGHAEKGPSDRAWECFHAVASEARKHVFDAPRGMLYKDAIEKADSELKQTTSASKSSSSMLVSTLAGIPPGRPTLLPPPNPTSAPVQYAIDYVKLLREQLLPGVKSETTGCAAGAETSGWPEGSALDLGKSDRLSCKCVKLEDASVPSQSQMKSAESLYLILWDTVFLLTAPERTCPGYGIVRYVGSMAVTEVSCVRDQPCQLRVKMSPTSTLLVIFDDESRCSIAYKHLERTRETSLRKEYEKLVDSFLLQDRYDDDRLRGV